MSALVPTLSALLEHADALFDAGRVPAARAAFELLLERAQDRSDRAMEAVSRAMLARCHLRRKDVDAARDALSHAQRALRLADRPDARRRVRSSEARLFVVESRLDEDPERAEAAREGLRSYLDWARDNALWADAIDACRLLADATSRDEDRASWLQMAVDLGVEHDLDELTGVVFNDLAVTLELLERPEEALEAWEQAHSRFRRGGSARQRVTAAWAAGTLAVRLDDYPLAQERLEEAVRDAEPADDCGDLLALALADLAQVHASAGDVPEAGRALVRALKLAREHDLAQAWPERWRAMRDQARRLDLEE